MYVHTFTHVYTPTRVHIHIHVPRFSHIGIDTKVCDLYMYIYTCTSACVYESTRTHTYGHLRLSMHTWIHLPSCPYMFLRNCQHIHTYLNMNGFAHVCLPPHMTDFASRSPGRTSRPSPLLLQAMPHGGMAQTVLLSSDGREACVGASDRGQCDVLCVCVCVGATAPTQIVGRPEGPWERCRVAST